MATTPTEGGCFCGALRYRLTASPVGSMVCHCTTCRRLFAAPAVAWLSVASDNFTFTCGTPATFSTSAPVTRWFCAACGTHVAYVHADQPGYVEVATCSLDDPAAFPPHAPFVAEPRPALGALRRRPADVPRFPIWSCRLTTHRAGASTAKRAINRRASGACCISAEGLFHA